MFSASGPDQSAIIIIDDIIAQAIARHASDVHFEPMQYGLRVRLRIDGTLICYAMIKASSMAQVISRLKVLAHINIAEKRIPQDGKFSVLCDSQMIDMRVSTFPSLYGQKVVVRILDRATHMVALENLGFTQGMLEQFMSLIMRPNGFFLVTGPTGSGKTTTLYAALNVLNSTEKNIVTLEDPVEYNVDGITQGHINPDAGFTFENGIRSLLRQDPDILMVGEMRDKQTAQVAIEAALTGHVVLSTLHTNDAPSAVVRLMDMGIEPFLINASVTGVLAQRLMRTICVDCKQCVPITDAERVITQKMGLHVDCLYKGSGCATCDYLGYKGRTAIFELLSFSNALRELVDGNPGIDAITAQAIQDGMITMRQSALEKVQAGVVTLEEMLRVVL